MAKNVQRRLTAILAADVVGYSRLMGEDEVGTLAVLRSHREALIDPKIAEHEGRIVKTTGDGMLVEFPSVVEAVQCAVEIQRGLAERNAEVPDDRKMLFRIGINIGDVIIEGDDIYGDGVNVAARLEGLAEPGGICISGKVYEEVRNKLPTAFEDLGEQEVKNIREPVRVYRWTEAAADPMPGMAGAEGALPLPDKPSIAVLPFENMSGDPEQGYFADGIAEDIIMMLSKASGLMVIARNSTFSYKGKATDVRQIGRELGVRYVLEGSTRKSGNRLRVTAQLIDTDIGDHVWADRYDRVIEDIFDLQDDITREVVTALRVQLSDGETAAFRNRGAPDIEAWRLVSQGNEEVSSYNSETILRARELGQRACERDPRYGPAWALVGLTFWYEARIGSEDDRDMNLKRAEECGVKASALDADNPESIGLNSAILSLRQRHEETLQLLRRGLNANPGSADLRAWLANCHHWMGDHLSATRLYQEAKRLNPLHPMWYYPMSARALDAAGNQEDALDTVREGLARQPNNFPCLLQLASLLGRRSEIAKAAEALASARLLSPDFMLGRVDQWLMTRDDAYTAEFKEGLRIAGLREA